MVYSTEESEYTDQSRSISHRYYDDIKPELSSVFPDRHHSNRRQRSIVLDESKLLARYNLLYLGAAIPSPNRRGLDSVQEPLSRRYPVDGKETVHGIETSLSIYENGLQIQFIGDPSVLLYYPIRSLIYCAGVRFAKQTQTNDEYPNDWRFVSLNSPEANQIENTQNPPIFTVTFRRTRHSPIDECHCFVAKTKYTALHLVEACYKAYHATDSQQDCSKVPLYFKIDNYRSKIKEIDNEIHIVPASDREETLDYEISKEGSGFFYKTDEVPIEFWQLWENHKSGTNRTSSNYSSSSRSSRSSNHLTRQRHFASMQSIPDSPKGSPPPEFLSKNNSTDQLLKPSLDPYTRLPDVFRVERIKDKSTGRDIYVRWLHDKPKLPKEIPSIQTSNYDYQVEKILSKETKRLALNNEPLKKSVVFEDKLQSAKKHHERHKSKKKHRKHKHHDSEVINEFYEHRHRKSRSNKTHRPRYNEVFNLPSPTFIEQQFPIPSFIEQQFPMASFMSKQFPIPSSSSTFPLQPGSYTFHTIAPFSPPNNTNTSSAYWYFTM